MANVVDDEFEQLLLRVKMANERSALFSTSADFFKNIQHFGPDRCRSIQMAFLNKIGPSLFRHITENEFNSMFSQLFLQSTADSLTTLIQFLSLISKKEQLKFCKLIQLIRLVQNKLLSKALLPRNDRHNHNEEQQLHQMPADHFAFLLCSFPERVYNFVGCSDQSAASIVNSFEDSLFDTLLQSLDECVQHQSSGLSIEMFARILSDYNSISEEFTGRFLAAILEKQQEELHSLLQQIFTFNLIDRRKREKLILVLIQLAPDAQKLQILFGDSVISDKLLRKCLLDKAILLSTAEHSARHSKKAANYLAAIGQPHLVSAFRELIQRFSTQCQIAELISLGSQFQLSLAIVDFAHKISPELRSAMREELADTLVPAFPQLLQQMDTSRRQIGMFLAETLFSLFNIESPPKFDYIEGDPLLQEFITAVNEAKEAEECSNGRVEEQTGKAEREATTAKVMCSRPRRGPIDPRVALLDSDDEEEAEQQIARTDEGNAGGDEAEDSDDGQPGPSQRRPPFPYLRDCLEALHSQQEDRQLWEAALKAILPMVRRRALAMDVLSVQLLETVLFLDNKFNTPHFGTIRENILKEVLASKPELVSHVARLNNSRSCSMAHRYLLLSAIVGAAKLLSGTEESNGDGQKPSKVKLALEEESGSKMNSTASGTQGPKVTWKSERLMAKNPGEVTSKADAFAAAAPQFAFPLLDLCTRIRPEQDSPLLGKTIWAIGQVLCCARNSPSILRITSAILSCLRHQQRAPQNIFVLTNCILCYSAIIHTVKAELLKTHFAEELNQLWEWLTKLRVEERERIEANEPLKHSIALLFFELSKL